MINSVDYLLFPADLYGERRFLYNSKKAACTKSKRKAASVFILFFNIYSGSDFMNLGILSALKLHSHSLFADTGHLPALCRVDELIQRIRHQKGTHHIYDGMLF